MKDNKKYIIIAAAVIVILLIMLLLKQPQTDNPNQLQVVTTTEISHEEVIEDEYGFRNDKLLKDHYEKHGKEMGFGSAEDYEEAASDVVNNPNALHKTEKEDGDDVYYVEKTNEFVIVSTDGYIRTYFNPSGGINYYNRQ
ncbi:MAG: hypothetical protein J6M65_04625 [Eubacterium sp.]|nr:hypothetical protein [Eubacterium sp.]